MTNQETKKIILEDYRELRKNLLDNIGVSFKENELWIMENLMTKINFMMELLNKLGLSHDREKIDKEYYLLEEIKRSELNEYSNR